MQMRILGRAFNLLRDVCELWKLPAVTIDLGERHANHGHHWFHRMVQDFARRVSRRHRKFPLFRSFVIGVATCRLPATSTEYFGGIEASARRNVKKARRMGYTFSRVNFNDHLEAVGAIRRSSDVRQGRPLPDRILREPAQPVTIPPANTPEYDYAYFGVLRDGVLMAYAGCMIAGELCLIEEIYGHAKNQPDGIVPMLIVSIAEHLLQHHPSVKWYAYGTYYGARESMRRFKRKFGFQPARVRWVIRD